LLSKSKGEELNKLDNEKWSQVENVGTCCFLFGKGVLRGKFLNTTQEEAGKKGGGEKKKKKWIYILTKTNAEAMKENRRPNHLEEGPTN